MQNSKKILANYNDKTITVYQAYNSQITNEILKTGTFGSNFKFDRMTWIKPSFLWMMYRCGWGSKENQERILAIDIYKEAFDEIVSEAVLSSYKPAIYESQNQWKEKLKSSNVRCQWDPDRDIYGNALNRRALQLGLSGIMVKRYVKEFIYSINDISENVYKLKRSITERTFDTNMLPIETEYFVSDNIKKLLGM